jgi:hypothetical protein
MAKPSQFDKQFKYPPGIKFADMTRAQKWIFAAKLAVCIATFGYAFPNVQHE